ncbi:MAG: PD40 domain-containing protein [Planctomycetes bacterium]|nr:PD40 domain-containing protein [Planctomycetota bacterium]
MDALARRIEKTGAAGVLRSELADLRREALLANPLLRDRPILFVVRSQYKPDHHNTATMFQTGEINADGSKLRQITFGEGLSDIDPIYLPDGKIVFSSTRAKYCQCNRHIMCNLFLTDADGKNIEQIGHSTLHEGHASLLRDGRVIYDRWEYVDRNFGDAQGPLDRQSRRHESRRRLR